MIQICYTKDWGTPSFTWYDELEEPPNEYPLHFRGYEYLTDEAAIELLNDPNVTTETKKAIKQILG